MSAQINRFVYRLDATDLVYDQIIIFILIIIDLMYYFK